MSSPDSRSVMWGVHFSKDLAGNVEAKQNHKGVGHWASPESMGREGTPTRDQHIQSHTGKECGV